MLSALVWLGLAIQDESPRHRHAKAHRVKPAHQLTQAEESNILNTFAAADEAEKREVKLHDDEAAATTAKDNADRKKQAQHALDAWGSLETNWKKRSKQEQEQQQAAEAEEAKEAQQQQQSQLDALRSQIKSEYAAVEKNMKPVAPDRDAQAKAAEKTWKDAVAAQEAGADIPLDLIKKDYEKMMALRGPPKEEVSCGPICQQEREDEKAEADRKAEAVALQKRDAEREYAQEVAARKRLQMEQDGTWEAHEEKAKARAVKAQLESAEDRLAADIGSFAELRHENH